MSDRPTSEPAADGAADASPGAPPDAPPDAPRDARAEAARFRTNLVRVLLVQVVTLLALWLVQRRYTI